MDDILKRLRQLQGGAYQIMPSTVREAADEIETLRGIDAGEAQRFAEMESENNRLRKAEKEWMDCTERLAAAGYRLMQIAGGAEIKSDDMLFACKQGQFSEEIAGQRILAILREREATADKLSGIWLHLDSWARGEADLEFIRKACASILIEHQCPGWKGKPKPTF